MLGNDQVRCACCFGWKPAGGVCPRCGCDETTQNAPHQLPVGTVLKEQYQIGRVLGQGGFGITYHGWDLYLDIPVAIKEYYPNGMVMRETGVTMAVADISGDDGTRFQRNRERFMREAKMLARFSQVPEVVQIKNFFNANNTAYIVMEYVEGLTLREYVQSQGGKLTPEQTFALIGPVIQTMAKVHKTGIVHRDISPDNVMIVQGGAKLLDFGAVRYVADAAVDRELTKSTEAILRQGYAPIEQYQKKGSLGPWTDVYALCATIYFCLTGQTPPDSPARVLEYEVMDIQGIPGLTPEQKTALEHGMELRADRRTGSMEQLYQELISDAQLRQEEERRERERREAERLEEERREAQRLQWEQQEAERHEKARQEAEQYEAHRRERERREAERREKAHREREARREQTRREETVTVDEHPETRPATRGNAAIIAVVACALVALVAAVLIGLGRGSSTTGARVSKSDENIVFGECGMSSEWSLNRETGVMEITGIQMYDFYLEEYERDMWDKRVERPWEPYLDDIREVVLDERLYRIGTAAFAHCKNLTKVSFGSQLKQIGSDAFWDTGLETINLPASLESIEFAAFEGTQLREVSIPMFVKQLEHMAFAACPNLEKVEILGSIGMNFDTWAQNAIFSRDYSTNVADITIWAPPGGIAQAYADILGYQFQPMGSGVTYEDSGDFSAYPGDVDGRWFFDAQSGFLRIQGEMPTDMLGQWEFDNDEVEPARKKVPLAPWISFADQITTVYIEEGVTRIADNAFAGCWNLTDIHLPGTLDSIGFQSFLATNIDEIVIPDSVGHIDSFAFNYCQNLRTVKMSTGLGTLQRSVFNATPMLEQVFMGNRTEFECWEQGEYRITPFNNAPQGGAEDKEYNLPENLTILTPQGHEGEKLSLARKFAEEYGVQYQEGVFLHENAQYTGDCVFGESTVSWVLEDNILYLTGYGDTPFYFSQSQDKNAWGNRQDSKFLIETGAPWYTFRNIIRGVSVGPGITTLNRGAFWDMAHLEFMDLGNVEQIYHGAISWCAMEHLEIPTNAFTIDSEAIISCHNLRSLWVHTGIDCIAQGFVQDCPNLEEIRFWNEAPALDPYGNLFNGPVPENLTVWGRAGSAAEEYAKHNNLPFEIIED